MFLEARDRLHNENSQSAYHNIICHLLFIEIIIVSNISVHQVTILEFATRWRFVRKGAGLNLDIMRSVDFSPTSGAYSQSTSNLDLCFSILSVVTAFKNVGTIAGFADALS